MNGRKDTLIWNSLADASRLLQDTEKTIAFVVHPNPDGDALGSALGLSKLLGNMGHRCLVISPNDYPDFLKWLPGAKEICLLSQSRTQAIDFLKDSDLIFVIDCNELSRINLLMEAFNSSDAYKVLIDHHPGPDLQVDCILSDTSASSTAELIYRFIEEAGIQKGMDVEVATCLFTGIMTDTGCFSYNSSNRKTFGTVAALLDYGIDKDAVYYKVYDNYSTERMRLLGFCLNEKMEIIPGYHVALISISREELLRYHFQTGDSEGFVNYPLSIRDIRLSALFMEKDDHIKISFRSKGDFSVNDFSRKYFNGGGHVNASGGESFSSLEETVSRFKAILPAYHDQLSVYED
jgi:bifunctional oligoribonuclease and PAP phosphatase NrnA